MSTVAMMRKLTLAAAGATVMALGATAKVEAGVIVGAVSVETDLGVSGSFALEDAINQSGLSIGYTSGVTDFEDYLLGNPTHNFLDAWLSSRRLPGSVTFDLGEVLDLEGMAMWGTGGLFSASTFELFGSLTGEDGSFTSLGSFLQNLQVGADTAQVFDFDTTARFIRMDITDSYLASNEVGIGEVAFNASTSDPPQLPEPASMLGLLAVGTFGAVSTLKRKRK